MTDNKYLVGVYDDERVVLKAVTDVRDSGIKIHEVFTPFPVHGLGHALGYAMPRMGVPAFLFGMTGTICAFLLTFWTLGVDWPMNIGGKNFFPFPTNIPIVFELTVLFAGIGMVVSYYIVNGLGFGVDNPTLDDRITDDKFCLAFQTNGYSDSEIENLSGFLSRTGASEVSSKVI